MIFSPLSSPLELILCTILSSPPRSPCLTVFLILIRKVDSDCDTRQLCMCCKEYLPKSTFYDHRRKMREKQKAARRALAASLEIQEGMVEGKKGRRDEKVGRREIRGKTTFSHTHTLSLSHSVTHSLSHSFSRSSSRRYSQLFFASGGGWRTFCSRRDCNFGEDFRFPSLYPLPPLPTHTPFPPPFFPIFFSYSFSLIVTVIFLLSRIPFTDQPTQAAIERLEGPLRSCRRSACTFSLGSCQPATTAR